MARNAEAETAFNTMLLAAIEQNEPPARRLVDDDLALAFLPTRVRPLVWATRPRVLRRTLVAALDAAGPGLWSNLCCRKRFIDDRLAEALPGIDAVVILGAGLDTRGYRLARHSDIGVFEVDQQVNIARKAATVRRALGSQPPSVRLVPIDFERDDLFTELAKAGYRTDSRTFFVWEGVTQYLTPDAVRTTLSSLQAAAPGSRLVFTYVRQDFIDGTEMYGAPTLYRRFRKRRQVWKSGMWPDQVSALLGEFGWRLVEHIGPDDLLDRYVRPAGRDLGASQIEWSAYAEKP